MEARIKFYCLVFLALLAFSCVKQQELQTKETYNGQYLVVLGVAQDAGYPQADCQKECCKAYWNGEVEEKWTSCLGIFDTESNKIWILDATPNFKNQLKTLQNYLPPASSSLAGVFLTHAHVGHYTGLIHLGREIIGTQNIPVYAMPRMTDFLSTNGPWDQLVRLQNINIKSIQDEEIINISDNLKIQPIQVPHRDEYSETVGYKIFGTNQSALFIPDIDKWDKWDKNILSEIESVDYAFLDGTFYKNGELKNRDMSQIPHPFIEESMNLFQKLEPKDQKKVFFIHLNHTNPLLRESTQEYKEFQKSPYGVAKRGMCIKL